MQKAAALFVAVVLVAASVFAEQPSEQQLKDLAKSIEGYTSSYAAGTRKKMASAKRGQVPSGLVDGIKWDMSMLQKGAYVVPPINMSDPDSRLGSLAPGWGVFKGRDHDGFAIVELQHLMVTGGGPVETPYATRPGSLSTSYSTVRIKGIEGKIPADVTPFALPPIVMRSIDEQGKSSFEAVAPSLVKPYLPAKLKQPLHGPNMDRKAKRK